MDDENKDIERDNDMSAIAERVFIIKPDKTEEFIKTVSKPMITKKFLEECKTAARNISDSNKK